MKVDLTEEEFNIINRMREERKEDEVSKIGFLKHNLAYGWQLSEKVDRLINSINNFWVSEEELEVMLSSLKKMFCKDEEECLWAPKGTKFIYLKFDGEYSWFDDEGIGIEDQDDEWAKKHLENIQEI